MSEDQTNEERNSKKKIDPTMVTPTDQVWPPFLSGEEVFNSGFGMFFIKNTLVVEKNLSKSNIEFKISRSRNSSL